MRQEMNARELQRCYAKSLRSFAINCLRKGEIKYDEYIGYCSSRYWFGCSILELRRYIESKFQTGMTWENWRGGIGKDCYQKVSEKCWELDHIKPLHLFNLRDIDQIAEASAYQNLQPLWHLEHKAKTKKEVGDIHARQKIKAESSLMRRQSAIKMHYEGKSEKEIAECLGKRVDEVEEFLRYAGVSGVDYGFSEMR